MRRWACRRSRLSRPRDAFVAGTEPLRKARVRRTSSAWLHPSPGARAPVHRRAAPAGAGRRAGRPRGYARPPCRSTAFCRARRTPDRPPPDARDARNARGSGACGRFRARFDQRGHLPNRSSTRQCVHRALAPARHHRHALAMPRIAADGAAYLARIGRADRPTPARDRHGARADRASPRPARDRRAPCVPPPSGPRCPCRAGARCPGAPRRRRRRSPDRGAAARAPACRAALRRRDAPPGRPACRSRSDVRPR